MAIDLDGTNQFLRNYSFAPNAAGTFTIGARVWLDATGNAWTTILKNWGVGVGVKGQFHFGLQATNYDLSLYVVQSNGTQIGPTREGAGAPLATGQWHAVVAQADGSNIKLFRAGSQVGSSVAYNGTLKSDRLGIGIGAKLNDALTGAAASDAGYWNGKIAEAFVSTAVWSADEIGAFSDGFSPQAIRRGVTNHWPLIKAAELRDRIGQFSLTGENSPTSSDHPRIIYPRKTKYGFTAAAAASGRIWKLAGNGGGLVGSPRGLAA